MEGFTFQKDQVALVINEKIVKKQLLKTLHDDKQHISIYH